MGITDQTFSELYHDNCHDYLRKFYIRKYAVEKYASKLLEIAQKIPKFQFCNDIDPELYREIIVCDQHAVIFTHQFDSKPILATYALNACVGLVIYASKYKIASIAHIDGLPGYSRQSAIDDGMTDITTSPVSVNVKHILQTIRQIANTGELIELDFWLVGGVFGLSEVMICDIVAELATINGNYKLNFRGRNLLGPINQSRNICIDSRNGFIGHFDYLTNSEIYIDDRNSESRPINIITAPRKFDAILDDTYHPRILSSIK